MVARLLELLGIRGVYRAITSLTCETRLPAVRAAGPVEMSEARFEEIRSTTRYFLNAQIIRTTLYVLPLLVFWWHGKVTLILYGSGMLALHIVFLVLDFYKSRLCARWSQGPFAPPEEAVSFKGPLSGWKYFDPKGFESDEKYNKVGFARFQNIVVWYVETTRLTREEKAEEKKIDYLGGNSLADLERFDHGTRVGELIHFCLFWLNVPLLVAAVREREPLATVPVILLVAIDFCLVLLQRQHRLRVWPKILKKRGQSAGTA